MADLSEKIGQYADGNLAFWEVHELMEKVGKSARGGLSTCEICCKLKKVGNDMRKANVGKDGDLEQDGRDERGYKSKYSAVGTVAGAPQAPSAVCKGAEGDPTTSVMRGLRCPWGHTLHRRKAEDSGYECDLCGADIVEGKRLYECRRSCDYCVCQKCHGNDNLTLTESQGLAAMTGVSDDGDAGDDQALSVMGRPGSRSAVSASVRKYGFVLAMG